MLDIGTTLDIGDHRVEVTGNPESHTDRYVIRVDCDPGGPGIKGDFPHIHPNLIETFRCVSGEMLVRAGRQVSELAVGEKVEVAQGQIHGFLNVGSDQLIVESEVIFPGGYNPDHDLMLFAGVYDRLKKERPVNRKTGEPPTLQMAVLTHAYKESIKQPGVAGLIMPLLAGVGRLAGYRSGPFEPSQRRP
ncbi:MAG TPA: cupin domain-containing protein [Acidimicrobiia bacterium]|jgi:mannose-6-phosphate isomerase-like protein (cupin superfamily)|nr:cupin domain-containing protein [Acidimicrobiia bacterium]